MSQSITAISYLNSWTVVLYSNNFKLGQRMKFFFSTLIVIIAYPSLVFPQQPRFVTPREAISLIDSIGAILVDVSSYEEYLTKHARHAISFSLSRLSEFPTKFPDTNRTYLLIGRQVGSTIDLFNRMGYHRLLIVNKGDHIDPWMNTTDYWEKDGLPVTRWNVLAIDSDTFYVAENSIVHRVAGKDTTLASFVRPTVRLLEKYRPTVRHHFGLEEDTRDLFDEVEEIASEISCVAAKDSTIWIGFSFYEGEGSEGYGGIGFLNLSSGYVGILRHPALVDCSARELLASENRVYVSTINHYEGGYAVCNGLVEIDLSNLAASAMVPPGTARIWDKDEEENVASFYEKPIEQLINDKRFLPKEVPQLKDEARQQIASKGYEHYMIQQAIEERSSRDLSISHARTLIDTTFTLTPQQSYIDFKYGRDLVLYFMGETWLCSFCSVGFVIFDRDYHFFPDSQKGSRVVRVDDKWAYYVTLVDFVKKSGKPEFASVTLHLTLKEVR